MKKATAVFRIASALVLALALCGLSTQAQFIIGPHRKIFTSGGGGAPAFVNSSSGSSTSNLTSIATTGIPVTGGANVGAFVYCTPFNDVTVTSVTSTGGDTFTPLTFTGGTGNDGQLFYAIGIASNGSDQFTCNFGSLTGGGGVAVLIYNNVSNVDTAGSVQNNSNNNPSPVTSPSFSTANATELGIACSSVAASAGQTLTAGNVGSTPSTVRVSVLAASGSSFGCEDANFTSLQSAITAKMSWSTTNFSWAINTSGVY